MVKNLGAGEFHWHPLYDEFKQAVEVLFGKQDQPSAE
jgi:hypothetical protein